jgi:phosphoribosylaminoimidazole-succinocarboxamide synthase
LADELSPDNMRLWKKGTKEKFDKDLFRKDEGNIVEAYKHILLKLDDMYKYFVTSRRI